MDQRRDGRQMHVLLVEDDPGDALLISEVFAENGAAGMLQVVHDGVEALAYVRREPPHEDAVRPDLILLDLNMPRMGGHEVLQHLKADERLATIPVVMLTTSQGEADVIRAYTAHASAYVSKPLDWRDLGDVVRRIDRFYSDVVRLPADQRVEWGRGYD